MGIVIDDSSDEPPRMIDEVPHVAVDNRKRAWRTKSLSRRIVVSCTDSEYDAIAKNSNRAGLSLTRFLVAIGIRELPPITDAERGSLLALIFQMKKAGVRLDQLTHAQHSSKFTGEPPPTESETAAVKQALKKALELVIERLDNDS